MRNFLHTRRIYRFGPFSLDAAAKVVSKDGEPLHLARKATETLLYLVEHAGRVVPKEELLEAVWPDRVVDEANLPQNIALIRKALPVEKGQPGHIETFAGRGYRLAGPVECIVEMDQVPPPVQAVGVRETVRLGGVTESAKASPAAPGISEHPGSVFQSGEPSDGTPPDAPSPASGLLATSGGAFRWGWVAVLVVAAALAAAFLLISRDLAEEAENLTVVPVTRLPGKEIQPAISPDGRQVAFVWEDHDSHRIQLCIQKLGEGSPRPVATLNTGRLDSPTWSPDAKQLAYLRFSQDFGQVVILDLATGMERVITNVFPNRYGVPNRHLDWSPDGAYLVVNDLLPPEHALSLFLVNLSDGRRIRLTKTQDYHLGDVDPRFSPDGKWIAFNRVLHRSSQVLCIVAASGGEVRQFTPDGEQVSANDWLASTNELVFASNRSGEFRLWKLRPASANPSKTLRRTGVYSDYPIQFSISRKSGALVYSALTYDLNIWRLDLAAPTGATHRWQRLVASTAQDASPQYSPDGARICFRSDRSGSEQLWVSQADGSSPVQITSNSLRPSVGRWAPDGKTIVFNDTLTGYIWLAEERRPGNWELRKSGWKGYHPVFSQDGKWVYAGTMNSIVRFPAAGGNEEQVAPIRGISLGFSRDGTRLFFMKDAADTVLWQLDVTTGRVEKLLDRLVPYCSSCWSTQDNGIYYLAGEPQAWNRQAIYYYDFATRQSQLVERFPEPVPPIGIGPFSLSPNKRYLLTVRVDPQNSDVMRVENFR